MTAGSFAELSRAGVERFLQTVLVIDNELTLEAPVAPMPVGLVSPISSLRASTRPVQAPVQPLSPPVPEPVVPSSPLDAKQIMDAFLRRSLICGMHKPTRGNDLVTEAIRAARRSDAVIVDWLLDGSDPGVAKDIIAGIVRGDVEESGRLRLIAVYTSEQDIGSISGQIRERLDDPSIEAPAPGVLRKADMRIVILNKEGTAAGTAIVRVADLPQRIIEEFTHLTSGILGTFAVTAIAAVRRATHHVLAIFSEDLDGAFLGHMCALQSPEDAREFALDLLGGELRTVASMNPETAKVLDPANLGLRIDTLTDDDKLRMGEIEVPLAIARTFPAAGIRGVQSSRGEQRRRGSTNVPSKADAVNEKNVGSLFHPHDGTAEAAHHRFARFASFRTEMFDRTTLPPTWTPTLTLGTLLVRLLPDGAVDPSGYLLCTQPRCDALRLVEDRMFPFQAAKVVTGLNFNLVAAVPSPDGTRTTVTLLVGAKPHDTRMILFGPDADDRVRGVPSDAGGFEFRDKHEQSARYLWIGDLRDLAAQRTASTVAARMHEVGLDEYEWLRFRAGKPSE